MNLDVGTRVRKARNHAGFTQAQLAKAAGTKQTVISDIENGRNKSSSSLYDIAVATKVNPNWLMKGTGNMLPDKADYQGDNYKEPKEEDHRQAPVLNFTQAGHFKDYFDDAMPDTYEPVSIDADPNVYWIKLEGLSMAPDFQPGELVLINPDVQPNPGDYVLALKDGEKATTFKKWRPRGFDENGNEYCELIPSNPDFPTIDSRYTPFSICGVAIEHKKRLR